MAYKTDFSTASSEQIEGALCRRLQNIRLARNITQAQLASEAGVSLRTIGRFEKGLGVSLDTFIRILIALGLQQSLAMLLPDPVVRPMERTRSSRRERMRARPTTSESEPAAWTWGDAKDLDE